MIRLITSTALVMTFCLLVNVGSALAHKPSDSYIKIDAGDGPLSIQWDIALKDLDFKIGLDTNQNGEITWGEVKSRRKEIEAYALSNLQIKVDGRPCTLTLDDLLIARHSDGAYAALMIQTDAKSDAQRFDIDYSLFFDVDPTHRGLVLFSNDVASSTYVLSPAEPAAQIQTSEASVLRTFVEFVRVGVEHIWGGIDHVSIFDLVAAARRVGSQAETVGAGGIVLAGGEGGAQNRHVVYTRALDHAVACGDGVCHVAVGNDRSHDRVFNHRDGAA